MWPASRVTHGKHWAALSGLHQWRRLTNGTTLERWHPQSQSPPSSTSFSTNPKPCMYSTITQSPNRTGYRTLHIPRALTCNRAPPLTLYSMTSYLKRDAPVGALIHECSCTYATAGATERMNIRLLIIRCDGLKEFLRFYPASTTVSEAILRGICSTRRRLLAS
jgi:hypothetical protein